MQQYVNPDIQFVVISISNRDLATFLIMTVFPEFSLLRICYQLSPTSQLTRMANSIRIIIRHTAALLSKKLMSMLHSYNSLAISKFMYCLERLLFYPKKGIDTKVGGVYRESVAFTL